MIWSLASMLTLSLGIAAVPLPAEARPALFWHWTRLDMSQAKCGTRALRAMEAVQLAWQLDKRGDDTVWASNNEFTSTIQCIREGDNSLAVIIATGEHRDRTKRLRDTLKTNVQHGVQFDPGKVD
jgi:hypothetical protein